MYHLSDLSRFQSSILIFLRRCPSGEVDKILEIAKSINQVSGGIFFSAILPKQMLKLFHRKVVFF